MQNIQIDAIKQLDRLLLSIDDVLYKDVQEAIGQQQTMSRLQGELPGIEGPIESLINDMRSLNASVDTAFMEIESLKQTIGSLVGVIEKLAIDKSSQGNNLINDITNIRAENPSIPRSYY